MKSRDVLADFFAGIIVVILVCGVAAAWLVPGSTRETPTTRKFTNVIIDEQTGCQYLQYSGSPIPRVDANGKHICVK